MRAIWLTAMLTLSTQVFAETSCWIVTTEDKRIFDHELAHCNGWVHDPWIYLPPPPEYVHPYTDGPLKVIMAEGDTGWWLREDVQKDAKWEYSVKDTNRIC